MLKVSNLEPISFIIGLILGIVLVIAGLRYIQPRFLTSMLQNPGSTASRQSIKVYEASTSKPQTLEGSHYKLKPQTKYTLQIINPDEVKELVWELVPQNFGEIDYNVNENSPKGIFADYTTPQVPDDSSGFIKICELDENNLCRNLNLPEIQVVISSK